MASIAAAPTTPTVNRQLSSLNSLYIQWTEGTPGDIQIDGYKLYMIEMSTGIVSLKYDGSNNEKILGYLVQNLVQGASYSFYVQAVNFNGISLQSNQSQFEVCLPPKNMDSPYFISSTKTSLTIGWTKPDDMGGCVIQSYSILMQDMTAGGSFVEVDAALVQNKPSLTSYTVNGLTHIGGFYQFKI